MDYETAKAIDRREERVAEIDRRARRRLAILRVVAAIVNLAATALLYRAYARHLESQEVMTHQRGNP